ncbi:MAG: hypothetical protein DMG97_42470 [Acidobacteria bacterium]|nr:MAG: hypothetical protein DMG98_15420 [Acidobacteriota bacterium]PYV61673.1 MAG: hypothetical protein DMG97_42470 [Acidobacteriota bacterium]PYV67811.1 MAG: hypothetical protein DMG96_38230 [Acidobacteriota bacterium]
MTAGSDKPAVPIIPLPGSAALTCRHLQQFYAAGKGSQARPGTGRIVTNSTYNDLSPQIRDQLKIRILDALACASALKNFVEDYKSTLSPAA